MSTIRHGVKRAVEAVLVGTGGPAIARKRRSHHLLVLAYHNIVPRGSGAIGDRSLHLSQDAFAAQLDSLSATHDVVPLRDAIAQNEAADARPRAAITFDDAYSGAITAGIAELRSRHLPATVFVTPGFLGGKSFWWDVFADTETGLDPALRERALAEAHGLSAMVGAIAQRCGAGMHDMPAHACGASLGQLHAALEDEKISLAAHTMNHPSLISLSDAELAQELSQPLEWLRQFGDRALPMVSYPYGLADNRVQAAARTAGYTAGFMIDGGWTTAAPHEPFAIPRLNIPAGVSRNGFILRAAGLLQG